MYTNWAGHGESPLLAGDVEQNPGPPKILKQGGPSSYKYTGAYLSLSVRSDRTIVNRLMMVLPAA